MVRKRGKINAFQGLRAIAFISIFLAHTPLGNFGYLGPWGVSVFFIMSGFLMTLSNLNKTETPKFGFRFAWNKIRSLYPLSIVTMLVMAIYAMHYGSGIVRTFFDMGLHTLLIQIWIPNEKYYVTLNSSTWYLCVSFFMYLCFPLILKFIRKYLDKKRAYITLASLTVMQILVAFIAHFWTNPDNSAWFNMVWFVYYFPLTRLIDFSIGCVAGYMFNMKKENGSDENPMIKTRAVVFEIAVCIAIVLSFIIYAKSYGILGSKAFKMTLLFMPATTLLMWLVASGEGILSRILSAKLLVKIGDLSPYTFLIHIVAIRYCNFLFRLLDYNNNVLLTVLSFVLTMAAAIVWKYVWNEVKQG